jgi:hypothetical protein
VGLQNSIQAPVRSGAELRVTLWSVSGALCRAAARLSQTRAPTEVGPPPRKPRGAAAARRLPAARRAAPAPRWDRCFWSLLARLWPEWRAPLLFVQPETVIRWHRTAWRRYWTWKSRKRRPGRPRIDRACASCSPARPREPALGRRSDRRRTPFARLRGERTHRPALSTACAPATTVTELAYVPAEPRVRDLGGRPVHGADAYAPHGVCAGLHRAWPQARYPRQRHAASDGTVDLAAGRRSDALESTAKVPHSRPRPLLRH